MFLFSPPKFIRLNRSGFNTTTNLEIGLVVFGKLWLTYFAWIFSSPFTTGCQHQISMGQNHVKDCPMGTYKLHGFRACKPYLVGLENLCFSMGWDEVQRFPIRNFLSQWLTGFELLGIPYVVGKIKFKLFFQGPLAK